MKVLVDGDSPRNPADSQFEMEGWVDLAPFEKLVGMSIIEACDGRAVLTMPFVVKLSQGGGFLHGGALTALADTAAAMAVKTCLTVSTPFATRNLSMRFLAPVRQGTVTAAATVKQIDGRRYLVHVDLQDDQDHAVAEFTADFRLLRPATGVCGDAESLVAPAKPKTEGRY